MDLRALALEHRDFAGKMLAERGSVVPMFVGLMADPAVTGGPDVLTILAPFRDDRQKAASVQLTKQMLAVARCRLAVALSEIWTLPEAAVADRRTQAALAAGRYPDGMRPSEREDRIEGVWITVESASAGHILVQEIVRAEAAAPTLGAIIMDQAYEISSWQVRGQMTNLLGVEVAPRDYLRIKNLLRRHCRQMPSMH